MKGTSFLGAPAYGDLMIGDQSFEFYDERNVQNYIQIPWEEIQYVTASVYFKGRWIPRFGIQTKQNGIFTFAARDAKKVLRAINQYIPDDQLVHSLSAIDVIKRAFKK